MDLAFCLVIAWFLKDLILDGASMAMPGREPYRMKARRERRERADKLRAQQAKWDHDADRRTGQQARAKALDALVDWWSADRSGMGPWRGWLFDLSADWAGELTRARRERARRRGAGEAWEDGYWDLDGLGRLFGWLLNWADGRARDWHDSNRRRDRSRYPDYVDGEVVDNDPVPAPLPIAPPRPQLYTAQDAAAEAALLAEERARLGIEGSAFTGNSEDLDWLLEQFEYELCEKCDGDSSEHMVGIDPLGNRLAVCLRAADELPAVSGPYEAITEGQRVWHPEHGEGKALGVSPNGEDADVVWDLNSGVEDSVPIGQLYSSVDPEAPWHRVLVRWPDGTEHQDEIRGFDQADALRNAGANWDAEIGYLAPAGLPGDQPLQLVHSNDDGWRELGAGPSDNADAGGDRQVGAAWARTWTRPTPGLPGHHSVLASTYYAIENEDTGELTIENSIERLLCTDPRDPGGTQLAAEDEHRDLDPAGEEVNDELIRQYALECPVDPTDGKGWDGLQGMPGYDTAEGEPMTTVAKRDSSSPARAGGVQVITARTANTQVINLAAYLRQVLSALMVFRTQMVKAQVGRPTLMLIDALIGSIQTAGSWAKRLDHITASHVLLGVRIRRARRATGAGNDKYLESGGQQ